MTANVITYRPRSAFREMSKILGFPDSIANRFSGLSSSPRASDEHNGRSSAENSVRQLEEIFARSGVPPDHPHSKPLLHLYRKALSLPRHLGQHPGGMIICDNGLDSIVPLQPAGMSGRTIAQWDKDDCADLGIVKVDLLGLGMLAAMEDSLRICHQRGKKIDLADIPYDDPATFDLLCRADTVGTFQVESRAQMATLPIMQPKNFYDLVIEIALIRPGPIVGDLVHPYLNRRNGHEPVDFIHPDFKPVLDRTLGVPLFQEQVLRMAMIIADFDGTEADELRRAMAFKRSDERIHSPRGHENPANCRTLLPSLLPYVGKDFVEHELPGFARRLDIGTHNRRIEAVGLHVYAHGPVGVGIHTPQIRRRISGPSERENVLRPQMIKQITN